MLGTGGDDEIVEGNAPAFSEDLLGRDIYARHLRQDDARVALAAKDAADRRGDVGGRQSGSRNLIEQGLEQVIVVAIDHHDIEWHLRQSPGGRQPAKSGSNDDDTRAVTGGIGGGHDTASLLRKPTTMLASPSRARLA